MEDIAVWSTADHGHKVRTMLGELCFARGCDGHTLVRLNRRVSACHNRPFFPRHPRFSNETVATALTLAFALACAAPAAAQRYTAKQNGDVIELADATAQMNVSVVWSMSNAWRIQVKGQDLVRPAARGKKASGSRRRVTSA